MIVGLWMAPGTIQALEPGGFAVSGGTVVQTEEQLATRFGAAQVDLLILASDSDHASLVADPGARERLGTLQDRLRALPQVTQVTGPEQLPISLSRDQDEALLLVSLRGDDRTKQAEFEQLEAAARSVDGLEVALGGPLTANVNAQQLAREDLQRAELVALPIALLILLVYFRRPLPALLPVVVGGFAITGTFPLLRALAELTPVSLFALNIVVFLGLGLAVDYSLFIVQRQREELAIGNPVDVALRRTLVTAGKTVLFSGIAVIVSLLALAWVPISLLRSIAWGGTLVVVLANIGALIILPTLLALLGHRVAGAGVLGGGPIDPRLARVHDRDATPARWARIAAAVTRRPGWVVVVVGVALLLTGAPALRLQTAPADARMFPPTSEIHRVHDAVSDSQRFAVDPSATQLVLVTTRSGESILTPDALAAVQEFAQRLEAIDGVVAVSGINSMLGAGQQLPIAELLAGPGLPPALQAQLDAVVADDATLLRVVSRLPSSSPQARAQLAAIEARAPDGLEVALAGTAAHAREIDQALAARLPWAALTVALSSFFVLLLAFGAPVVALAAVILNALSLTASFGALVFVFQDGRFEQLLGYRSIGTIEPTVPVMMFALVFGLSMDYQLFLLSRIREAWLRDHDDSSSVVEGLTRTGAIITTAAVILIVFLLGLAAGTLVFMKQLGIGMALAILLDATLIRLLLVPASMGLLGKRNWWAPRWLTRARAVLRLELREGEAEREA
ncbi:Integral membrane protein [Enhygromyxa salina]|uniref:Integral membrane protein n=1 Tax=Enhygromyxa salina TaxID=215803 RepID=A0A0C2D188_9BACT|nr:Integral membrane protein [Enhygromyxa salina]